MQPSRQVAANDSLAAVPTGPLGVFFCVTMVVVRITGTGAPVLQRALWPRHLGADGQEQHCSGGGAATAKQCHPTRVPHRVVTSCQHGFQPRTRDGLLPVAGSDARRATRRDQPQAAGLGDPQRRSLRQTRLVPQLPPRHRPEPAVVVEQRRDARGAELRYLLRYLPGRAYCSALITSMPTNGSLPSTQASCPGGMV